MGSLDPGKLVVIFVLALIVLGPERLPATARRLGATWRTLSHYREQVEHQVHEAVDSFDLPSMPTIQPRGMLSDLFTADVPNASTESQRRAAEHSEETTSQPGDPYRLAVRDRAYGDREGIGEAATIAVDHRNDTTIVASIDVSMN